MTTFLTTHQKRQYFFLQKKVNKEKSIRLLSKLALIGKMNDFSMNDFQNLEGIYRYIAEKI